MRKKVLAVFITLAMVFGLLPAGVVAYAVPAAGSGDPNAAITQGGAEVYSTDPNAFIWLFAENIPVTPGEEYEFSFWVYSTGDAILSNNYNASLLTWNGPAGLTAMQGDKWKTCIEGQWVYLTNKEPSPNGWFGEPIIPTGNAIDLCIRHAGQTKYYYDIRLTRLSDGYEVPLPPMDEWQPKTANTYADTTLPASAAVFTLTEDELISSIGSIDRTPTVNGQSSMHLYTGCWIM